MDDRTTCVYRPTNGTFHVTLVYRGGLFERTFFQDGYDTVNEMIGDAYSWIEYVITTLNDTGATDER